MTIPTLVLGDAKTTLKTLIYIPMCNDFSRNVMDYRYRLLINTNLANGMKETLPIKHLHLVLNFDEPDLWLDQLEAVSGFDGYLVLQINRKRRESWQSLGLVTDEMVRVKSLAEFYKDVRVRMCEEDFKPAHVIIVGDGHTEKMSFLSDIMILDTLKGPEAVRGWKVPLQTKEETLDTRPNTDQPVKTDFVNQSGRGSAGDKDGVVHRFSPRLRLGDETK